VLDEDTAACEETNSSESEVQEENEVLNEELPVGLVDEDAKKSEAEKSEYNTEDTQLEQSLVEEKEEVKSSEESDGYVKIELQKENDELEVDAPVVIEESGIGNNTKLSSPESLDHGNEEAYMEGNDVTNMSNEKLAQQETKVDAELNGDMKLLEENEKLRKLMKELLEAGNEQLSVISNLTGRVKDLEKKLAKTKRNKKVRTKRHKPVTPKMSCSNSS
jgi:predicted S18 family serine protease